VGIDSCEDERASPALMYSNDEISNNETESLRQWKARIVVPVAAVAALMATVVWFGSPTRGPGKDLTPFMVDRIEGKNELDDATKKELLDRHNAYRCMHEAAPMTWDGTIAEVAQSWADKGKFEHAPDRVRTDVAGFRYLGENLAWNLKGGEAVDRWYDEIACTSPKGKVASLSQGVCRPGHYTQVVWKSTTKLGCGYANDMTVCMYGPAGNYRGKFDDQVPMPTKTAAQCGGLNKMPTGVKAYLATLPGKTRVSCNAACVTDGQGYANEMHEGGKGRHTVWTCGCSKGSGVNMLCTPGPGQPFEGCVKLPSKLPPSLKKLVR